MNITRKRGKILIDQEAYLETVLKRFSMENCRPADTPLPSGYLPVPNASPVNPQLRQQYQQVIGSLLYLELGTRPDIAFAVTKMATFAANPSQTHLDKALYICRYLRGTSKYAIVYNGKEGEGLEAFTDSDWGTEPKDRKSISGYFFKLAGGIISWQSRTQKTVALSSTEAEYMAASDCARQAAWMKQLLQEIRIKMTPIPIAMDNQGSIFIAQNPVQNRRTKHIDIRYHYIRECISDKKVEVFFIPGTDNPADMFTKNTRSALSTQKFIKFRNTLGIEFYK